MPPRDGVTLAAAIKDYVEDKKRSGKSPATVETDQGHLDRLDRSLTPGFLVQHVEKRHIEAFLNRPTRKGTPPSGSYRQRVRASLQHFFGWAMDKGLTRENPAAEVHPPRPTTRAAST